MKTKKGKKSKIQIMNIARKLFYHNGYKKTTLKMIANELDISDGNITYYFKSKFDLSYEIIMEDYDKHKDFIISNIKEEKKSFNLYAIVILGINRKIFEDNNLLLFHIESILSHSAYTKLTLPIYKKYNSDFDCKIPSEDIEDVLITDYGARCHIFNLIINKKYKITADKYTRNSVAHLGRLLLIDEILIQRYISEAFEFWDKHDCSHIKLLYDDKH